MTEKTTGLTGELLLRKWQAFVSRYLVMTPEQSLVLALWAIHTHFFEKYGATPYLEIYSAVPGRGKSRVLDTLALLCRGGEYMSTARIAPIVRMIAERQNKITLLIDEAEKLGAGSINETRSALAAGYRKGASHPVTTAQGVIRYPTFCPKAFALIGNIQPVIRDRAIPIFLHFGKPEADLLKEHAQAIEAAEELKTDLFKFGQESKAFAFPPHEIPDWLYGRNAEIWTPLWSLALAMKLHKQTMEQLQAASVDMSALKELEPLPNRSPKTEQADGDLIEAAQKLLSDVLTIIEPDEVVIPTEELLVRLRRIPTSPWRVWRGKGLDAILLSALLETFGLGPESVQVGKGRKDRRIVRGYKVAKILAAKS